MTVGVLVDLTRCMGCRGCQVACKQWNQLEAEESASFGGTYENPPALTADTWTKIQFHEFADAGPKWRFRKQQCYHCEDASCVNVRKRRKDATAHSHCIRYIKSRATQSMVQ